jgi:hypothetical protein
MKKKAKKKVTKKKRNYVRKGNGPKGQKPKPAQSKSEDLSNTTAASDETETVNGELEQQARVEEVAKD